MDLFLLIARFAWLALLYLFIFWAVRAILKESPATPEAAADLKIKLNVIESSGKTRRVTVGNETSIGRGADNDIVLDDSAASAHHARLVFGGGRWTLLDLDSQNGTFINGQSVSGAAVVKSGDEIMIGRTKLRV